MRELAGGAGVPFAREISLGPSPPGLPRHAAAKFAEQAKLRSYFEAKQAQQKRSGAIASCGIPKHAWSDRLFGGKVCHEKAVTLRSLTTNPRSRLS